MVLGEAWSRLGACLAGREARPQRVGTVRAGRVRLGGGDCLFLTRTAHPFPLRATERLTVKVRAERSEVNPLRERSFPARLLATTSNPFAGAPIASLSPRQGAVGASWPGGDMGWYLWFYGTWAVFCCAGIGVACLILRLARG